jgi:hypothetical protein
VHRIEFEFEVKIRVIWSGVSFCTFRVISSERLVTRLNLAKQWRIRTESRRVELTAASSKERAIKANSARR